MLQRLNGLARDGNPTRMLALRAFLTVAALAPMAGVASAQPIDPYKQPTPPSQPNPPAPGPAPQPPAAPAPAAPRPVAPTPPAPDTPQDPYAASGPAAPSLPDPVLAERVAHALVNRAQELLDERSFLDAKQLAVEALVGSPRGASADRARSIIHAVNQQLGIQEDTPRPEPKPQDDVDTTPIRDPTLPADT